MQMGKVRGIEYHVILIHFIVPSPIHSSITITHTILTVFHVNQNFQHWEQRLCAVDLSEMQMMDRILGSRVGEKQVLILM